MKGDHHMSSVKKTSYLSVWGGLILILSFVFVLNYTFAQDQKPAKELVIGALFAVTGQNSFLGEPEKNTAEMLVEEINSKGGVNGMKVKLIVYDTEGEPTIAVTKAKKLIETDKVDAIIGPTLSGTSLAIVPEAEKAGIPLVSCAASVKITQPVKKWVFKTAQSDMHAVEKIIDYLKFKKIDKVAIITVSNAFGDSGKEQLQKILPQNNVEIVASESFGSNDADASAQLTKIKGTVAQAVICWGTNPGPAIVAKNMKLLNMKQELIQSHGVASNKFIELAGDASENIILPAGKLIVADLLPDTDPQKKTLVEYKNNYMKKFNTPVSTFGGHAYDALMLVVKAAEIAGNDKAKLRDEIEKTKDFVGISGIFTMSPEEHNGLTKDSFTLVTIKNGKWALMPTTIEGK